MQYKVPDWLKDFDGQPPPYQSSPRPRPGGASIGTSGWGGSWGPAQATVVPPQGGGPVLGGGMETPSTSWLPTSMLQRGTK